MWQNCPEVELWATLPFPHCKHLLVLILYEAFISVVLFRVSPLVVLFRVYSGLHASSLTQPFAYSEVGASSHRVKFSAAQKRLHSDYLSWHIFERYTTVHIKKDSSSCSEEFQGSGQRTLKILCLAQCFLFLDVTLREILMCFSSERLPNCLVMETTYRDCSVQCLKTYFLPVSKKVNNYIFTSSNPECHL